MATKRQKPQIYLIIFYPLQLLRLLLVFTILGHAWMHYAELRIRVTKSARVWRRLYPGNPDLVRRIGYLHLKTHLGANQLFWDPLFGRVATILRCGGIRQVADDDIWDLIIPTGTRALQAIRKHIPSHEGTFPERIPSLL